MKELEGASEPPVTRRRGPRYRAAIFDFDGTLADSFPIFLRVVNDLAAEFDFTRIEESDLERLRSYGAREMVRHLGVPVWKLPRIAGAMRRRMADVLDEVRLFDGVGNVLRHLQERGIVRAIVTSNAEDNVRRVLGAEYDALIDVYECGASVFGKRAKLRRALARCGVAASEAIAIGDEIRDLEAARREGIPFGAVAWGYTTVDALVAHAPDELFTSVAEIADRLG
jgi:phosphoglycolate phosphatase